MRLSHIAIEYTLRHLLSIAFPRCGASISVGEDNVRVDIEHIRIHFWLMSSEETDLLLQKQLTLTPTLSPTQRTVPIYRLPQHEQAYRLDEEGLHLYYDLLTLPFLLLSRYEEMVVCERDPHQRFPYRKSLTYHYGFIDYPIIDEYAMLLRQLVTQHYPTLSVQKQRPKVILTHDIDILFRFGNMWNNFRTLFAGDLIARHSIRLLRKSLQQYRLYRADTSNDPYNLAILKLITQNPQEYEQIFFFLALPPYAPDFSYAIDSFEAKRLMETITLCQKGVGLHGSYHAHNRAELFLQEKARIEATANMPITHHRQHYLRFDAMATPQIWAAAGIKHDYTLGYAEREGFRCGTCHPFPLFDLTRNAVLPVIEHPLIAMDTTMIIHQKVNMRNAYLKLCYLLSVCQSVEGEFVFLWHNTSVEREYESWYREVYLPFIGNEIIGLERK